MGQLNIFLRKKASVFFMCFTLLLIFWFIWIAEYDSYRFKIYHSNDDTHPLWKILGVIPNGYYKEYKEIIFDTTQNYSLININWLLSPKYSNSIVYFDKKKNNKYILKGRYTDLIKRDDQNKSSTSCLTLQMLDLDVFNLYLSNLDNLTSEQIKQKYCYILSGIIGDNSSIKIIKNQNDYIDLLSLYNRNKLYELRGDQMLNSTMSLNFSDNDYYCWFWNQGLLRFSFDIDKSNSQLKSVDCEFLGFLGIEQ